MIAGEPGHGVLVWEARGAVGAAWRWASSVDRVVCWLWLQAARSCRGGWPLSGCAALPKEDWSKIGAALTDQLGLPAAARGPL